jgi:hypothetical protein
MLKKIFSDDSGTFDPVGVTQLPLVIKNLTLRTPTPPADRERLDQFPDLVLWSCGHPSFTGNRHNASLRAVARVRPGSVGLVSFEAGVIASDDPRRSAGRPRQESP